MEFQGVEDPQSFIDAAADIGVVDGETSDDALGVDDEEGALSDSLVFDEDAVGFAELVAAVAEERDVDAAEAAFEV